MIWYLLYPFRGTTEPPVFAPQSPLRRIFTRYGNAAARHPVITLLISVATAATLIYPFPFLYTNNFASGASNLPHHVWTSAHPVDGEVEGPQDVVMRSIWVHGSYMKALDSKVLLAALQIQDELLGETVDFDPRRSANDPLPKVDTSITVLTPDVRNQFHAINGYWSCSAENIAADLDILSTVNQRSQQSTILNVTLRHSIVFSGKRFEENRLVAADALVITLVHKLNSPVARHWESKAEEIARNGPDRWRLIPSDGRSVNSTLYEFRFQPLSFQDDLVLATAYGLTTLYFFLSLSKLRALKSRIGLVCAVMTQIAASIMSSFTICAVFKIDVSKIPREAYPLVILTIGLENIFRLINAVILTPSELATAARMADALGRTGHLALAGVTQNLIILWMLVKIVSPGVAAFCNFAAIAIVFDLFYLLTFFVAVLSIDVRRLELSDSLTKASLRHPTADPSGNKSKRDWLTALRCGEVPVSTRLAGTGILISFVLGAQWHFLDDNSIWHTLSRISRYLTTGSQGKSQSLSSSLATDINMARTPTAWLRLQDHETAHEVIKIVKPGAHSIIARVYDPLIFVLHGADRTRTNLGVRPFLPAAYDFIRHQSAPFLICVLLALAAVSLLMNYLLWDEMSEMEDNTRPEDHQLLSIKTPNPGHALDVVLLTASTTGVVASVGLDRRICIWDVRQGVMKYVNQDRDVESELFPVLAMAIDNGSHWLALLSPNSVALWNIDQECWGPTMPVDTRGRIPSLLCLTNSKPRAIPNILLVRSNGLMTELFMEKSTLIELQICKTPLLSARSYIQRMTSPNIDATLRILTSSRSGCIHVASKSLSGWISEEAPCETNDDEGPVSNLIALPSLDSFLAVRDHTVDLVDITTYKVIHTFATEIMKPETLKCLHSTRKRPQCGSVGLAYFSLVYTTRNGKACVLQSYFPERDDDTICFRDPESSGSRNCCPWREALEVRHTVENPGVWEIVRAGYIVGVRRREKALSEQKASHSSISKPLLGAGLRRREHLMRKTFNEKAKASRKDEWEVWSLSRTGEILSTPLSLSTDIAGYDHLLVDEIGPIQEIGERSLAVGVGNVVKIITVGHERYDTQDDVHDDLAFVGMSSARRKKGHASKKPAFTG